MISLAYPFAGPSLSVEVRDPDFQDKQDLAIKTSVKTMMDGSIRTKRSTPANVRLVLKFSNITRRKALEVRDFIATAQGSYVMYVDYEGTPWKGTLLTDPEIMTYALGLGSNEPRKESNQFTLEFEGSPIG